jgi:UDP-2,3-diacylglucosamine hydrolase
LPTGVGAAYFKPVPNTGRKYQPTGAATLQIPPHSVVPIAEDERVVFFSDAHLGGSSNPESQRRTELVCSFLESLPGRAEVAIILGDLFDFYFEYRSVVPARYLRVLNSLEALTRAGVRTYYVAGNHDFWLGKLFTDTLGITVEPDALLLNREGEKNCRVLASHGDGLGEGDTGYKILKALLRNPLLISAFRLIHPDWGYAIANLTSRTSRKHTSRHQDKRVEAAARVGQGLLEAGHNLDTVILAHTHTPDDRSFEHGRYLNTGDWCNHFSWIEWTGTDQFAIKYFTDSTNEKV